MCILGLRNEALLNSVETEGIMITVNGRRRLEPGEQEKFFRTPDGKIIMLAQPNCGAMGTVDLIIQQRNSVQRFGSGWPKSQPAKTDDWNIRDAFKGLPFPC